MIDFLTFAELRKLTGTNHRKLQEQWLRDRAWPYTCNRHGAVKVDRRCYELRMGLAAQHERERPAKTEPRFEAIA